MATTTAQTIQPYLFFDGRCEEALEFYKKAIGAQVTALMRFKDSPEPTGCPTSDGSKVMHAMFHVGTTAIMASDGRCEGKPSFTGFSLSINAVNENEAARFFHALAEGGQVQMPLGKTFFAPAFGMLIDRFGVCWMVITAP